MTLTAHVKAGRLIVDEPTDLPEGTTVELVAIAPGLEIDALKDLLEARWQASESGEPTETAADVREHFRRRSTEARSPA
jgi:hypothetical protein